MSSTLDETAQHNQMFLTQLWYRLPIFVQSLVLGLTITVIGTYGSLIFLIAFSNALSLAIVGVLGFLSIFSYYLSGNWKPKSTVEMRRTNFRNVKMTKQIWMYGILLAFLFVVIGQSGLVLTFRLIQFDEDRFTDVYNFGEMEKWVAWCVIFLVSIIAGVSEEIGFRGYMQVPLETRYGLLKANIMVSIVFVLFHLNQAWAGPVIIWLFFLGYLFGMIAQSTKSLFPAILAHTLIDIFNFSFWWSDVAGEYDNQPISKTGVDFHFIFWVFLLFSSLIAFFAIIQKLESIDPYPTNKVASV